MSDLISRSRAIENIWDVFNSYANDSQRFDEYETEAINNAFTVLQKTIESQPTVYDPDKVVEELDKASFLMPPREKGHYADNGLFLEEAIDIVRKGGVK